MASVTSSARGGYKDQALFYKIDIDEYDDASEDLGVTKIPLFLFFDREGKEVRTRQKRAEI